MKSFFRKILKRLMYYFFGCFLGLFAGVIIALCGFEKAGAVFVIFVSIVSMTFLFKDVPERPSKKQKKFLPQNKDSKTEDILSLPKEKKAFLCLDGQWCDITHLVKIDDLIHRLHNTELVSINGKEKKITITYKDSKNNISERAIVVHTVECETKGEKFIPVKLQTFCLLSKSHRTFLVNRIQSAFNTETGEVISDIGRYLLADV